MAVTALLLAAIAFGAGGLGRLLLGRPSITGPLRALGAECLIGFLGYCALFGVAAHRHLSSTAAGRLAFILALVAVFGVIQSAWSETRASRWRGAVRDLGRRLLLAVVTGASVLALRPVIGNAGAADPLHYAYIATSMFHDAWLRRALPNLPVSGAIVGLMDVGVLTRAPAVAMLWPPAALGSGLDIDVVTRVSAWLLVLAFVLLADTLSGFAPLAVRVVLAAAGVGVLNAVSILIGGQINQSLALVVVLAAVWLCRVTDAPRARLIALALVGNVVAAAYPEFLLAVPLYFGCIVALRPMSLRRVIVEGLAIALGTLSVQLSTGFGTGRYLLTQSSSAPGWWPLPVTPRSLGEVWVAVVFQDRPEKWLLLITVVAIGLYLWKAPPSRPESPLPLAAVCLLVLGLTFMVGVWSWLTVRAGNVNYATFKLSGWLGPGLLLLGWLLLRQASSMARWALATAVLTVAVARVVALGSQLPTLTPANTWRPAWTMENVSLDAAPCVVRPISARYDIVLKAIAEPDAPRRGCAVRLGRAPEAAAIYAGRPPSKWRRQESKAYVVGIENASTDTWGPDASAAELAVRFLGPGAEHMEPARFRLPSSAPGGRVDVRVEVAAPSIEGSYTLEHRVIRGKATRSEQALMTPVTVE